MFGLDFIRKLKPCKWRYIGPLDDGREHFGFLAQEVDSIAPHGQYGFVHLSEDETFMLAYGEFIGPMAKAIQELDSEVKRLREELKRISTGKEFYGAMQDRVGHNKACQCDPLGLGHDLEKDVGDV